ncbi:MAG: MFS transporter [Nitrospiraceae bacterium]|nr:MFS transporter [Nitrospiraceae bacterium]
MSKGFPFPHPYFSSKPGWKWFILTTVLVGATMSALDVSIVNVAMPTLQHSFNVSLAVIEWVAMAYMLTLTIFLPLFGRLADMYGRTKLYTTGFVVFTIGSVLCGMAPTASFIIFARVLQAVGAGLLQANSVAIITQAFPGNERGKAIGIQGAVQAVAMSIGPFVGGILIHIVNWRAIFYVNLPIGIVGVLMALLILPKSEKSQKKEKIDFVGILTFSPGLAFMVLALNKGEKLGWTSHTILGYLALAFVLLTAFIITELKVEHPMIDLKLFKNYTFSAGNFTGMLSYYVLFAILFLMPFYMEEVLRYPVALTGTLLTPIPLAMAVIAPVAGSISDKHGSRIMTATGMFVCAVASFFLMFFGQISHLTLFVLDLILLGIGMGMFTPPNNSAIMGAAPREKLGLAGGILNMMRSLGLIFGVDISGLIFTSIKHKYYLSKGYGLANTKAIPMAARNDAFMRGFVVVMGVLVGLNILAAILSAAKKDESLLSAEEMKEFVAGD